MNKSMKSTLSKNSIVRISMAGALSWLLPGAGHIFIGERVRGIIFLVAVTLTFWTGMCIGGVKSTVDPQLRPLWFIGQVCAGGHSLTAMSIGQVVDTPNEQKPVNLVAYGTAAEVAVIYTGISGMLSVLIIMDVLVRAEAKSKPQVDRAGPNRKTGGKT
jgi:hypothetical protein